jgi:hypothetical protein
LCRIGVEEHSREAHPAILAEKRTLASASKCAQDARRRRGWRIVMEISWFPRLAWAAVVVVPLAQPSLAAIPAPTDQTADERAVLAADAQQRLAVASKDIVAIGRISDPHLRVNAPNNRILTRDDLMRMVASGEIRNEVFERTPEDVVITGDVGVVMGHETVFPGAASEQARMYGRKTLNRRYTNVFIRTAEGWRHLARHANIMLSASSQ